jgi:hypothetical protein
VARGTVITFAAEAILIMPASPIASNARSVIAPIQILIAGSPLLQTVAFYNATPPEPKQARVAGLFDGAILPGPLPAAIVPVTPMVPPPAIMPVIAVVPAPAMMTMPARLGGQLAGVILHRRGDARIDQRQRLRALGRRGNDEQSANGEEAQNFLDVQVYPPWVVGTMNADRVNRFPLCAKDSEDRSHPSRRRASARLLRMTVKPAPFSSVASAISCRGRSSCLEKIPGYRAFASQGPGGGMGTASNFTQMAMAILVYGASVLIVGAGLIGALRRH